MTEFETVIGLEVHVQLATKTKLFSASAAEFGGEPNTRTDALVLGLPGSLPVLNEQAVVFATRLGLALGCSVERRNVFARKNYFYPDLPKNYQISQFKEPICLGGAVPVRIDGELRQIELERIHLEEDAGKSMHEGDRSRVDLNRAGVPLVEIVSKPVMSRPEEAGAYLGALRQMVRYLEISDGNMEEGSLRCDANLSLRPKGQARLGTKVEIKNLNSISGVVAALRFEQKRQAGLLKRGEEVEQQTRSWDADREESLFLRGKEDAHDYRYFPDPDLLPVQLETSFLREIEASLPELPAARYGRFVGELALPAYDAEILSEERGLAEYFERTVAKLGDAKPVSNWILSELLRELHAREGGIDEFPVGADSLAELLALVRDRAISGKMAKDVFLEMIESGRSAAAIVEAKGLQQISGSDELSGIVEEILEGHEKQVAQYLGGKETVLGFFVGQVMKQTRGQANPAKTNELLREALERRR